MVLRAFIAGMFLLLASLSGKVEFALLRGNAKLKRLHHLAVFHPLRMLFVRVAQA